jgi:hypothetical protein
MQVLTIFLQNLQSIIVKSLRTLTKLRIRQNHLRCNVKGTVKGTVYTRTGHEEPEGEKRHSSTLSLTSAPDGDEWSTPRPGRFTPGKDPVPIVWEAGWASGPVWKVSEKLATPAGFDPRTVQPVASRYTSWAIPAHIHFNVVFLNN